jgi:hypothetical protein
MRSISYYSVLCFLFLSFFSTWTSNSASAEECTTGDHNCFHIKASLELGRTDFVRNLNRWGNNATTFDLTEGSNPGASTLFQRYSFEFLLNNRHGLVFLFQPFGFGGETLTSKNINITGRYKDQNSTYNLDIPELTPIRFKYTFDFFRFSYQYDFFSDKDQELAIGFTSNNSATDTLIYSLNGQYFFRESRFPVMPPILFRLRARQQFSGGLFLMEEFDGMYIYISHLVDTAFYVGWPLHPNIENFFSLRYIGQGGRYVPRMNEPYKSYLDTHALIMSFGLRVF